MGPLYFKPYSWPLKFLGTSIDNLFKGLLRGCYGFFNSISRVSYGTANVVFSGPRDAIQFTAYLGLHCDT